jgi:hypothetical protein
MEIAPSTLSEAPPVHWDGPTASRFTKGEDLMQGYNTKPSRSLFGVTGLLLWTLFLVTLPTSGFLNLTGAGITMAAAQAQQVSPAYRAGRQAGRADAERDLPRNPRSNRWTSRQDRVDYDAGYSRGYSEVLDSPEYNGRSERDDRRFEGDNGRRFENNGASINIGRDNVVRWQAPATVRVYVQVDNEPMKLFAEGASGSQAAPWIESGHSYLFVARDLNGNEIARDRLDLRRFRR